MQSDDELAEDYGALLAPRVSKPAMNSYPNPFNAETIVQFELPRSGQVELSVYNVLGQRIRRLVGDDLPRGSIGSVGMEGMPTVVTQRVASI